MAKKRSRASKDAPATFKAWYVTLPIAAIAFILFAYYYSNLDTLINNEDNPFGAIGLIMVYAVYMGVPLLVGGLFLIVTIVLVARNK